MNLEEFPNNSRQTVEAEMRGVTFYWDSELFYVAQFMSLFSAAFQQYGAQKTCVCKNKPF